VADHRRWAVEEFGEAKLGDSRRVGRLLRIATALFAHVAGTVTASFGSQAERNGAYDFLGNAAITLFALTQAIWTACAKRCAPFEWVFVPVDGSSLGLLDPFHTRGTGRVGTHAKGARGFIVMTAMAVTSLGVSLGICGQQFWTRGPKRIKDTRAKRKFKDKETHYWVVVVEQVIAAFQRAALKCVPWFQIDRGGDVADVLLKAVDSDWRVTVRAAQNRRMAGTDDVAYLWETMLKQRSMGTYRLEVPAGNLRTARTAQMSVRACTVSLRLLDKWTKKIRIVKIGAVLTREINTTPAGEKPIEWMLLTTAPIRTFEDAKLVIFGYSQRWKIEIFHRCWKSGRCEVEKTQLHTSEAILKWATILASVAMRTLQITQQARSTPEMPADQLLTRDEIDVIILLRKPKGYGAGDVPTLGKVVRWIAEIGGFTNKGSKAHPGKIVVGRGLNRIAAAVELLGALRGPKTKGKR